MLEPTDERRELAGRRSAGFRLLVGVAAATVLLVAAVVAGTVVPASASGLAKTAVAAPTCGTKPVTMQAYFETGFPHAEGTDPRVHQAVPERQVEHPRGPVRGHHPERSAVLRDRIRPTSCGCRRSPSWSRTTC